MRPRAFPTHPLLANTVQRFWLAECAFTPLDDSFDTLPDSMLELVFSFATDRYGSIFKTIRPAARILMVVYRQGQAPRSDREGTMNIQLGNVNLFVRDIERARRFYVEALGLVENKERSAPPGFVLLEAGDCTLTLQDGSAPGANFGPAGSVELGFAVEDVEGLHRRLHEWGGAVSEVQQMGWGGGFDTTDPDGHRLTIYRMRE